MESGILEFIFSGGMKCLLEGRFRLINFLEMGHMHIQPKAVKFNYVPEEGRWLYL